MSISFFLKKRFSPFERRYIFCYEISATALAGRFCVARGTRDTKIQVIEVSVSSLYISSLCYYPNITIIWDGRFCMFDVLLRFTLCFVYAWFPYGRINGVTYRNIRPQSPHVKISQLVNKMCSQQACSKVVNKLYQCCYFIKLLQSCHSQLVNKLLNCRTITSCWNNL
jgi:hypothetical protein